MAAEKNLIDHMYGYHISTDAEEFLKDYDEKVSIFVIDGYMMYNSCYLHRPKRKSMMKSLTRLRLVLDVWLEMFVISNGMYGV